MERLPVLRDELRFLERHLAELEAEVTLGSVHHAVIERIERLKQRITALEKNQKAQGK